MTKYQKFLTRLYQEVWTNVDNEKHNFENVSQYKQARKMCWKSFLETGDIQEYVNAAILDKAIAQWQTSQNTT